MPINRLNSKILESEFYKLFSKHCPSDEYVPAIHSKVGRIVAFGDIHGDYDLAVRFLIISKVAKYSKNGKLKWIGGKTVVVQVGDQVDRCRKNGNMTCDRQETLGASDEASDVKIMRLYTDMHYQASKVGGAVISLLGNHEIMNSRGFMDYVSYMGLKEFEGDVDPSDPERDTAVKARYKAFAPGGKIGTFMGCTRLPCVIIGSNIFVHAGIVDGLIDKLGMTGYEDFETINRSVRMWLWGLLDTDYVKEIIDGAYNKHSFFWTRILGTIPKDVPMSNPRCSDNISRALKLFKVGRIIVGHTPQSFRYNEDINATCSDTVFRIDNGSSAAFDLFDNHYTQTGKRDPYRRAQYLEILNDNVYNICDANGCKSPVNA